MSYLPALAKTQGEQEIDERLLGLREHLGSERDFRSVLCYLRDEVSEFSQRTQLDEYAQTLGLASGCVYR